MKRITNKDLYLFLGVGFIVFVLCAPALSYRAGDLFFGKFAPLYNVELSELFYRYAANPIIGKAEPYAHYQLSRTYFIQGKLEESLAEADRELLLYPEHLRTHYIKGLTLGYMRRSSEAVLEFKEFIKWKPESWAARNDCAWLQFRKGDIEGALETINPAIHDRGNPWVQNTYGVIMLNKREYSESKKALTYAYEILQNMDTEKWGIAYPGNDPRIYDVGLEQMRESVRQNLLLIDEVDQTKLPTSGV